jgi:hypothetical protein
MMSEVRSQPCSSCPYRRDVPSGVWAESEYEKLRDYDAPTGEQPLATFHCHATPEHLCHGWVAVHMHRGHANELLALRMWPVTTIPPISPDLFGSGNEAADHGEADIATPSDEAEVVVDRLIRKYPRLRTGES